MAGRRPIVRIMWSPSTPVMVHGRPIGSHPWETTVSSVHAPPIAIATAPSRRTCPSRKSSVARRSGAVEATPPMTGTPGYALFHWSTRTFASTVKGSVKRIHAFTVSGRTPSARCHRAARSSSARGRCVVRSTTSGETAIACRLAPGRVTAIRAIASRSSSSRPPEMTDHALLPITCLPGISKRTRWTMRGKSLRNLDDAKTMTRPGPDGARSGEEIEPKTEACGGVSSATRPVTGGGETRRDPDAVSPVTRAPVDGNPPVS